MRRRGYLQRRRVSNDHAAPLQDAAPLQHRRGPGALRRPSNGRGAPRDGRGVWFCDLATARLGVTRRQCGSARLGARGRTAHRPFAAPGRAAHRGPQAMRSVCVMFM
ncbi:hypothetical protein M885DRAFT_135498 [Pelagophyceae sp. CCMP2097]|nr:hypothetical protein M885DRAFT_135498 [Pelagophyceae sp. CCMP2097]